MAQDKLVSPLVLKLPNLLKCMVSHIVQGVVIEVHGVAYVVQGVVIEVHGVAYIYIYIYIYI